MIKYHQQSDDTGVFQFSTHETVDEGFLLMICAGGAVAVDCVSRAEVSSRVAAVVLENTFTSIPDMAKVLFSSVRLLARLPHWCHKNKVSY